VTVRWMFCCCVRRGTTGIRCQFVVCVLTVTASSSALDHKRVNRLYASLTANHGSVSIVSAPGVRLTAVDVGFAPSTFECVAGRVSSNSSSFIVLVVYRPGSSAVTSSFYAELGEVLDRLSTFVDAVVLVGDVNIRPECKVDPQSVEFCDLLAGYDPTRHWINTRCTRDDMTPPNVDIIDVGISDHRLRRWSSRLLRPPPVYSTSTRRSWRAFDLDKFQAELRMSALCDERHVDRARRRRSHKSV